MNDTNGRPGMKVTIRETGETRRLNEGPFMFDKLADRVLKVVPTQRTAKCPDGTKESVNIVTIGSTIMRAEDEACSHDVTRGRDFCYSYGGDGSLVASISQAGYDYWNGWAAQHRSDMAKLKAVQDKYLDENDPKPWSDMCKTIRKNLFPPRDLVPVVGEQTRIPLEKCFAADEHARFEATFKALHDEYGVTVPNPSGRRLPDTSGISMEGPDEGRGIV